MCRYTHNCHPIWIGLTGTPKWVLRNQSQMGLVFRVFSGHQMVSNTLNTSNLFRLSCSHHKARYCYSVDSRVSWSSKLQPLVALSTTYFHGYSGDGCCSHLYKVTGSPQSSKRSRNAWFVQLVFLKPWTFCHNMQLLSHTGDCRGGTKRQHIGQKWHFPWMYNAF